MARIKKEEEINSGNQIIQDPTKDMVITDKTTVDVGSNYKEPKTTQESTTIESKDVNTTTNTKLDSSSTPQIITTKDIPEYADQKLKMYPEYSELYIDKKGGVYTSLNYESILYKNPYHIQ